MFKELVNNLAGSLYGDTNYSHTANYKFKKAMLA